MATADATSCSLHEILKLPINPPCKKLLYDHLGRYSLVGKKPENFWHAHLEGWKLVMILGNFHPGRA
jgi:hypothetical protein